MLRIHRSRERAVWAAVVAVLATTACWLAAITVTLLARQAGLAAPEWLVAGRALVRVAWMLVREAGPVALLALVTAGLIIMFLRAHVLPANGEARHV
jgi:hypothetical protein